MSINKKELIEIIANEQDQLPYKDIELSVKTIIESMIDSLKKGKRIEIRGFGTFKKKINKSKLVRNPKTNEKIFKETSYKVHFKIGKTLHKKINQSLNIISAMGSPYITLGYLIKNKIF